MELVDLTFEILKFLIPAKNGPETKLSKMPYFNLETLKMMFAHVKLLILSKNVVDKDVGMV